MAAKSPHWHSYLKVILSRENQRVEHFQKAENTLLIVLERVNAMDPRFTVEYSRNLEALEFALCAAEDEVTMQVPLCINADDLLIEECSGEQNGSETVNHGNCQMPGTCCIRVAKDDSHLKNWTQEDVFIVAETDESSGDIVPGKVLCLLKELLVAAIVHCKHHSLIRPGELSAEKLKDDDIQLPLLISSGWKMIRFNIVPVIRRKQNALKLSNCWQEKGFPQGSVNKVIQEAEFIPASYYHWRYCTNRPILKLVQIVSNLKGHYLDSLRLLVQVNYENWKEEGKKKGLTSHHLEMVLLWATHLFPSPEDWISLEGSVYRLLVVLLCCLVTKDLPHFLYPEQNLFQNDSVDLSNLYPKVENFACTPELFLKFRFATRGGNTYKQMDNGLKTLLHLPAEDKSYWNTAFFDMLLNKFQMYQIKDTERTTAMSNILSKTKKMVNNQH
ncbi:protein mab-21-like 4 [Anolis sagrei]|uniref:protein mab-21-like 4 n=1 Tax=Anolis sagrei TaxID=38937 RepID=UPI003522209F